MSGEVESKYDPPRRFPRVKAPIHYREARDSTERSPVIDIGLGGLRLLSFRDRDVGSMWDIEVLRPDGSGLTCTVKVIWVRQRLDRSPPQFELGVQFVEVPTQAEAFFPKILADYA
jgi:hypothetical protein